MRPRQIPRTAAQTEQVTALRAHLHECAETSDSEQETARTVAKWLDDQGVPVVARGVGGHGVLARVESEQPGPTRLFRADLDALPLRKGATDDESDEGHAHHACGHDGHMAMLAGALAELATERTSWTGCVLGLFQPAEETGHGALRVLDDPKFPTSFDQVFAIHNLPGIEAGTVRCRVGPMACASTGLELRLAGRTAHAAHPEAGHNPIPALAELVPLVLDSVRGIPPNSWGLVTPIHIRAGKIAYGTAAGRGSARFTLRADSDDALEHMVGRAVEAAQGVAETHSLRLRHARIEPFPATLNHESAVHVVQAASKRASLPYDEASGPQRWSEDFGHFTSRWPGALIGLGSGLDQAELHTPDYEFPDALLPAGIALWSAIAHEAKP